MKSKILFVIKILCIIVLLFILLIGWQIWHIHRIENLSRYRVSADVLLEFFNDNSKMMSTNAAQKKSCFWVILDELYGDEGCSYHGDISHIFISAVEAFPGSDRRIEIKISDNADSIFQTIYSDAGEIKINKIAMDHGLIIDKVFSLQRDSVLLGSYYSKFDYTQENDLIQEYQWLHYPYDSISPYSDLQKKIFVYDSTNKLIKTTEWTRLTSIPDISLYIKDLMKGREQNIPFDTTKKMWRYDEQGKIIEESISFSTDMSEKSNSFQRKLIYDYGYNGDIHIEAFNEKNEKQESFTLHKGKNFLKKQYESLSKNYHQIEYFSDNGKTEKIEMDYTDFFKNSMKRIILFDSNEHKVLDSTWIEDLLFWGMRFTAMANIERKKYDSLGNLVYVEKNEKIYRRTHPFIGFPLKLDTNYFFQTRTEIDYDSLNNPVSLVMFRNFKQDGSFIWSGLKEKYILTYDYHKKEGPDHFF